VLNKAQLGKVICDFWYLSAADHQRGADSTPGRSWAYIFNVEIYEISHQERITVDGTSPLTERIINRKYNSNIKYMI
jgi:hypothetical protein